MVEGEKVYMAGGTDGLIILDHFRPTEPALTVSQPVWDSQGRFRFSVSGPTGVTVRVQFSTDLRQRADWRTLPLQQSPVELTN